MVTKFEKLSKKELLEQIRLLQTQYDHIPADKDNRDDILHELQVHKIELEMQNRELREAQKQLDETRDSYADLYDFAPVNYLSFDEKGIIRHINLTSASMLGKVRTNIIGCPFSRWLEKESSRLFRHHLNSTLQSDKKIADELHIKNEAGERFDVRIESIRHKDLSTGDFLCRSVIIDVTESNSIKNKLFLQARQLKLITDSLPVLIAYLDADEKHLFANKTYMESFHLLPGEALGKSAREVWGSDNYIITNKYLKLALAGQQMKFDIELPLGERGKKYFHTILIPDCDSHTQVYGVIVVIGDITDRIALEAIDRSRLLDIAHFSRLGTMGEMASEIAHELNQPLAAISIYSDACRRMILSGKGEQEKIIQSLIDISTQAERAGDVIRHIRAFVSKKEPQKEKVDLNELVKDALQLLAVEIRSHNVNFELILMNDIPHISVDKILIEQVIFNLARNALEAMDEIEPSLRELKIQTSASKAGDVEIKIDDSGPGLSIEETKKIFEPFHSTKKEGMGMGLTISYSIIDAHHGHIWAAPNNHGGTTISFTLPLINEGEDYAT